MVWVFSPPVAFFGLLFIVENGAQCVSCRSGRVSHLGVSGGRDELALSSKLYKNKLLNMMIIDVKRGVNACVVFVVGGCWMCELLLEEVEKRALVSGNSMTWRETEKVGCTDHPLY